MVPVAGSSAARHSGTAAEHGAAAALSGARGGASADSDARRPSRTRPTIERHVPLAAGRPLRPTVPHFFIFPPNVTTAVSSPFSHKSPL